jgi:hypothetical protein
MRLNLRNLLKNESGVVLVEFAYSLPIFMGLCLTGLELANFTAAKMRVSQITMTVADNLSRAKQAVPLGLPQLREHDVNDALIGANQQGGTMGILTNGRIIVSSLQRNASGGQWIAWQRCKGKLNIASAYGAEDTGKTGTAFKGMGPGADLDKINVESGSAIIFAEVSYTYQSLVANSLFGPRTIKKEAAFYVRDDRDMVGGDKKNGMYNPDTKAIPSTCNLYNDT